MTELLYLQDSYLKEFDAVVKEVHGKFIVLDKTAFYPQGGGQPSDTGHIIAQDGRRFSVLFVKKMGADISHEIDQEGLRLGEIVKCTIDWDKRYRLMRYHTAAHILSAVINEATGAQITGNQLDLAKARIDFNLETFDREKISMYLQKANDLIAMHYAVETKEMPREEAFKIPSLVKLKMLLPESIATVRVVIISEVDQQACGGTHVSNTKEIGPLEIVRVENKGAKNRRVYFVLKN